MRLPIKSFFEATKRAKTCESFFRLLGDIGDYSTVRIEEPLRVLFHEISTHCPSYEFILHEPVYIRLNSRAALYLMTVDMADLSAIEIQQTGIAPKWVGILRDISLGSYGGEVFGRMLTAIDDQAKQLGVDTDEYRQGMLPHLKLALAYNEAV